MKDLSSYSNCRKFLEDDELAILGVRKATLPEKMEEGDECLVKDILLLLKASRRSARHSIFVLDQVKEALLTLSFPMR